MTQFDEETAPVRAGALGKVLLAPCWMQAFLQETGHANGYQLERGYRGEFSYRRPDGAGKSTSSLFDRYARGDSMPCGKKRAWLKTLAPKSDAFLESPLVELLEASTADDFVGWIHLVDLAPHLACKILTSTPSEDGEGNDIDLRDITPRLLNDLSVQGDEYALTCLLAMVSEYGWLDTPHDPNDLDQPEIHHLRRRQRIVIAACHCLVFFLTLPHFRPVRTVLVALIRQRFLDVRSPPDHVLLLERYDFIAIGEKVEQIKQRVLGKKMHHPQHQRRFYRELLAGAHGHRIVQLLSIPFECLDGMPHHPLARLCYVPRAIELEIFRPHMRGPRQIHFGKKAKATLQTELGDYWV